MVLSHVGICWMGNRRTRKPSAEDLNSMRATFILPQAWPKTRFPGSHSIPTQVYGRILMGVSSGLRVKRDPLPLLISGISVDTIWVDTTACNVYITNKKEKHKKHEFMVACS